MKGRRNEPLTVAKRAAFGLATVIYVFAASGLLSRLLERLPSWPLTLVLTVLWPLCSFAIVLAPLCVLAALARTRLLALTLSYVGLLYVGIWGGAVIGGQQLAFDPPPGHQVSWQIQVTNSFVFLAIFAVLQFAPTAAIWLVTRAFIDRGRRA